MSEDYKYEKTIDGITYVDSRDSWLTEVDDAVPLVSEDGAVLAGAELGILSAAKITVTRKFIAWGGGRRQYQREGRQMEELADAFKKMHLLERTDNVHLTLTPDCKSMISFILVRIANDADLSKLYFTGTLDIKHAEHTQVETEKRRRPFYYRIGELVGCNYDDACREAAFMCCREYRSTGVFIIAEDFSGLHWMCPCPELLVGVVPKRDFTSFLMSQ